MKISIIAGYPPPHGGVTTHVRRLSHHLETGGVDHVVYNTASETELPGRVISVNRRRRWWLARFVLVPDRCVYIMSSRTLLWLAGATIAVRRGHFVALRLQNSQLVDELARKSLRGRLAGKALRRFDRIVCVNAELVDALTSLGIDHRRVLHFPGFLPPLPEEVSRSAVCPAAWDFLERHPESLAASGRVAWHDGTDLYGFDLLVELLGRLAVDYPKLALIVCLWDYVADTDNEYISGLEHRAVELGVRERILFNRERGGFLPVLQEAKVMVRPTATDGDANSIREALVMGVPAVVSDVVERPAGAVVVPSRDLDAFEQAVRTVLDQGDQPATDELNDAAIRLQTYVDELRSWTLADS